jgi:hypothetical protein
MAPSDQQDPTAGSVLRELIFNQYQAIVLGGAAVVSLIALTPLPLLVWLGSEMVLLPILDSGPLRRLVQRRKMAIARARTQAERDRVMTSLTPAHAKRYAAMEQLCRMIETNYQSLTGISQAYLSEQRGKLDVILQSCLHRLTALQRYERMPAGRSTAEIEDEIADLEKEIRQEGLPPRAAAALQKNLELKRRLLASVAQVGDTVRTLLTELDSMESLLEVLHQNSISLRDPLAISEELDTIVQQSEHSERVVREMEALLGRDAAGWQADIVSDPVSRSTGETTPPAGSGRRKVKSR